MAEQPIIVVKKKARHAGSHGGAWKVAYADFVTAMMALFIVLWLLGSEEKVKQAVGGYFQDPSGNGRMMGSTMAGAGEGLTLNEEDMEKLKEKLEAALKQSPDFEALSRHIQITVTGEGLRIELLEDEDGVFFQSGSAKLSERGRVLVVKLAAELGQLPNPLYFEGHTDAKPFTTENTGYGNWELSADRANAARRLMMESGVRRNQVGQIRGFAAMRPRVANNANHPSNRRISIMVQYLTPPPGPAPPKGKARHAAAPPAGEKKEEKKEEKTDKAH